MLDFDWIYLYNLIISTLPTCVASAIWEGMLYCFGGGAPRRVGTNQKIPRDFAARFAWRLRHQERSRAQESRQLLTWFICFFYQTITFSKPSPLQTDEVNFLYSTLFSCSTTWRGSKVCNQKESFLTVLICWRNGYLIAGEVASSQSQGLIIPRPLCVSGHVARPRRPGKTPYRD